MGTAPYISILQRLLGFGGGPAKVALVMVRTNAEATAGAQSDILEGLRNIVRDNDALNLFRITTFDPILPGTTDDYLDFLRKAVGPRGTGIGLAVVGQQHPVMFGLVLMNPAEQGPLIDAKELRAVEKTQVVVDWILAAGLYLRGAYREALLRFERLAGQVNTLYRPLLLISAGSAALRDFQALAAFVHEKQDEWGMRARAVRLYQNALEEWASAPAQYAWAAAHNNLAWALAQSFAAASLQEAITHYQQALDYFSQTAASLEMQICGKNLADARWQMENLQVESKPLVEEVTQARAQMRKLLNLPEGPYSAPRLQVAHRLRQATTLSGDFYNLITRDDGSLAIYMVDVEGHGLVASSQAQAVHQILSGSTEGWGGGEPAKELAVADEVVQRELGRSGIAVTMNFTEINDRRTLIRHANAGMPNPLLFRAGQGQPQILVAAGAYVGGGYATFPAEPRSAQSDLRPGDLVVLFSDGVTEARDPQGRLFGANGIIAAVARARSESVERIADEILDAAARHAQQPDPQDDQTLLVVRILE